MSQRKLIGNKFEGTKSRSRAKKGNEMSMAQKLQWGISIWGFRNAINTSQDTFLEIIEAQNRMERWKNVTL